MPCFKPILLKSKPEKGKKCEMLNYISKKNREIYKPIIGIINKEKKEILNKYKNETWGVQCRKCIGCLQDRSREWSIRGYFESLKSPKQNYFITLTYNNENLPRNEIGNPTTIPSTISEFMKALRKKWKIKYGWNEKINFIGADEYGSLNNRPHYHIIIFGLPFLNDLIETGEKNELNQKYYQSATLEKLWHRGIVKIGKVNYESISYVTRYTIKKSHVPSKNNYINWNINPEKLHFSKGIGLEYFKQNYEAIYRDDKVTFITAKGKKTSSPPRYFDRKMAELYPDMVQSNKKEREKKYQTIRNEQVKDWEKRTGKKYTDLLGTEQSEKYKKIKKLKNKLHEKKGEKRKMIIKNNETEILKKHEWHKNNINCWKCQTIAKIEYENQVQLNKKVYEIMRKKAKKEKNWQTRF